MLHWCQQSRKKHDDLFSSILILIKIFKKFFCIFFSPADCTSRAKGHFVTQTYKCSRTYDFTLLKFILTSDLKSAGRVVGILQRNWRDYVVTFPPRDGTQSQSRNSQRILAVPWDRRIPKIRISTQQADALQVWITLRFMYLCDQKGNLTLVIFLDRAGLLC